MSGPLGCLGFFLGSMLAIFAIGPSALGSTFAGWTADGFDADRAGTLEIEGLELNWFGRQSVRQVSLRAPDGEMVLRGTATFPSLMDLFGAGFEDFGAVEITVEELNLSVDQDGVSNLTRALAIDATNRRRLDVDDLDWTGVTAEYAVRVEHFSWQNPRTRQAGQAIEIEDVECAIEVEPGHRVKVTAKGEGALELDVAFVWDADTPGRGQFLDLVRLDLPAAPTTMLDALVGRPGLLSELLGPTFTLAGHARGHAVDGPERPPRPGPVELTLKSAFAELSLAGTRVGDRFVSGGDVSADPGATAGLVGTVRWPAQAFERTVGRVLGAEGLVRAPDGEPVTIALTNLSVPTSALFGPAPLHERLSEVRADLDLGLGDWRWTVPGGVPGSAPSDAEGASADTVLEDLRLFGELAHDESGRLVLDLRLADRAPRDLTARLLVPAVDELAAVASGRLYEQRAVLELQSLPTAAVERWLGPSAQAEFAEDGVSVLTLELLRAYADPAVLGGRAGSRAPELSQRLNADLRCTVPRLAVFDPERPGSRLELRDLVHELKWIPGLGLQIEMVGRVVDLDPGGVEGTLSLRPAGDSLGSLSVEGSAGFTNLQAAVSDAWLGTRGSLEHLFGPRLEQVALRFEDLGGEAPRLDLSIVSRLGSLKVAGRLEDGALVGAPGAAAEARFDLTPRAASGVAVWLLPLFERVSAADGGERARLAIRDFRLPLDADSSKLAGNLTLSLGAFQYVVLPELAEKLKLPAQRRVGRSPARDFELRLSGGLARYVDVSIPVGDDLDLEFTGTFDLVGNEVNLQSRMPMALLLGEGKDQAALLEMLGGVLDEEEALPLVAVQGDHGNPRVLVDSYGINDLMLGLGERALREAWPTFLAPGKRE